MARRASYDESRVPEYTLPDPLVFDDGRPCTDTGAWTEHRRLELIRHFESCVYGRTLIGRPPEMTWTLVSRSRRPARDGTLRKTVRLLFAGDPDGPGMDVVLTVPANRRPAPVFLLAHATAPPEVLARGYGVASARIHQVQQDRADGYATSIRRYFAPADHDAPREDEWGSIGVWAWALSRAMDYLEQDEDVDAGRVVLNGFSRYGKTAMWAGAQDARFAMTCSGEAGCGGQVIVRRQFGETVKHITAGKYAHWFAGRFREFADDVTRLPVDWHELVALHAPRPVYIATAELDLWGDPRGSFLAARHADCVYRLFGCVGLGVAEMPPVNTPVGGRIGFHCRTGFHGQTLYDWERYLDFADRWLRSGYPVSRYPVS